MSSSLTFTTGFALNDDTAIAAGAGDALPTFAKSLLINKLNNSSRSNAIIPVAVKLVTFDIDGR